MPLRSDFPTDPHAILDPGIRWYPGDDQIGDLGLLTLIPPLVHKIREGVKVWRDSGYAGASPTTRALLHHWFRTEHLLPQADGSVRPFAWYFAQREAVESAIWLYEVERARDPYALMKYDGLGRVSRAMFTGEDWPRYVMKLATGAGKTKVMSLLIAWSYFHKLYEPDSDLSTNFLLIAPNIIVLERLRTDFDGARIFYEDPILPPNGHEGQNWQDDFQVTVHIQDQIGHVAETGNLFLTNIHRVFEGEADPSADDEDLTDWFLGRRPKGKTTDGSVDLGVIIRDVPDLVVLNDEAHHIHDANLAWFRNIEDIAMRLRQKGSDLSAQFDLSATPRHTNGAIFVQTISDYPLVEAIRQQVVKKPVVPDEASRARLSERPSTSFAERFEDYLDLGHEEWEKASIELEKADRKAVLFVMTSDTKTCDEVAAFLETKYPKLAGRVLVIHTNRSGEISESASSRNKAELEMLRRQSREIDSWESPYRAVVSVLMLREGWDVQNVTTIVGLRPYNAPANILPEQTLGRGLRRMFRGEDVEEKLSVVGTDAFMDFVSAIKSEGVDLEEVSMGAGSRPKAPLVIEVDRDNPKKDIEALDIALPVLTPRLHREWKDLGALDVSTLGNRRHPVRTFSEEERRQIVFIDIDTEQVSHVTEMGSLIDPTPQAVIGFYADRIRRELRLVGGFDVLFEKVKTFAEHHLFDRPVALDDLNILRNLSEPDVRLTLIDSLKAGINRLTVQDRGTTELRGHIKLRDTRVQIVKDQPYYPPRKSIFSKVVGDSGFELRVASFLDTCPEVAAFAKNTQAIGFRIEYRTEDGSIANYYPDFLVRDEAGVVWIIETKGREEPDDRHKFQRLRQWCADASRLDAAASYRALYVREEDWNKNPVRGFAEMTATFGADPSPG